MQHRHTKVSYRATQLAGLSLLASVLCNSALADPTRISVAQFSQDTQKVNSLKTAIAAMRTNSSADPMSAQFRTSFAYWGNTHGYFGTGGNATDLEAYIKRRMPQCLGQYPQAMCDVYYKHMSNTSVPADGYTQNIWGTCQHGNLFFLPWHRFYLHYFERTVRKQSGDVNFALPYWNYFDNYNPLKKAIALPPLVTGATNTLYDQWRTPGLNEKQSWMDPTSASATQAFGYPDDFTQFSDTLQGQPHGTMHCATGSGCTMPDIGFVPIAGLDPVFYMHHANIDRLWQCWMVNKAKGQTIDLAWAKQNLGMTDDWYEKTFSYIDENGNPVTLKVADVFSSQYIPQYDNLTNCDAQPSTSANATASTPLVKGTTMLASPLKAHAALAAGKAITLGNTKVNVKLQAAANANNLTAKAVEPGANPQTYLILEDVKLQGAPSLTYKVFLTSKANPKKSSYIATFNYFGVGDPAHAGHEGHGDSLGTLVYKVSNNLAELGITSAEDASVSFEPSNMLVGKKFKAQKTGDGVTVGNIRLETSSVTPKK